MRLSTAQPHRELGFWQQPMDTWLSCIVCWLTLESIHLLSAATTLCAWLLGTVTWLLLTDCSLTLE